VGDDDAKALIDAMQAEADGADAEAYRAHAASVERAKQAWDRGRTLGVSGVAGERSKPQAPDEPTATT
jgi:multidrug resistance efflux pump